MTSSEDELFVQRIALTMIDGVGDHLARQLISYCGSVQAVFREKKRALEKIPDIGPRTATSVVSFRKFDRAEKELEFIRRHNILMYFYLDEDYPARLKNCNDAPVLIYYKGTVSLNHPRMVAIVGTRNATSYGKDFTSRLVAELGAMNVIIVSGLAYGIDITAHRACVNQQIETIGVMAHGLDRIYPYEHRSIAGKMISHGALVTEHASGSGPDRENFPRRNRIIAGLSDAVVVVEAAKKGGALITAEIANSYNRDVFALPGRICDPCSEGCNMLIKSNKAALIQSAEDIRYIMGWDEKKNTKGKPVQKKLFTEYSPEEKIILDIITTNEKPGMDTIVINSGMMPGKVASLLLQLEFSGSIRCLPGNLFALA